jgi:predicted small secreted protein
MKIGLAGIYRVKQRESSPAPYVRVMERNYTMFRKTALALAALSVALAASACNTVKGLGRDVESVGQAGDRAVNR